MRRPRCAVSWAALLAAGCLACSVTREPPALEAAAPVVVTEVSPADGMREVPRYTVPSLTFSADLHPDSVEDSLELRTGYFSYPGQVRYHIVDRVLTFTPIRLDGDIRYHLTFLGARDLLGRSVQPFGSSFFTGAQFGRRPAAPEPVIFSRDIQPIFRARCALAGCHWDDTSGAFSLRTTTQSITSLVGKFSPLSMRTLVVPGSSTRSYLVWKLLGLDPLIYGERMPKQDHPLSQDELRIIARWIDEGAENLPGGPPDDMTPDGPGADMTPDGPLGDGGTDGD